MRNVMRNDIAATPHRFSSSQARVARSKAIAIREDATLTLRVPPGGGRELAARAALFPLCSWRPRRASRLGRGASPPARKPDAGASYPRWGADFSAAPPGLGRHRFGDAFRGDCGKTAGKYRHPLPCPTVDYYCLALRALEKIWVAPICIPIKFHEVPL